MGVVVLRKATRLSTAGRTQQGKLAPLLWRTRPFGPVCVESRQVPLAAEALVGQSRSPMADQLRQGRPRPARVLIGEPFPEVRQLLERAVDLLGHQPVAHQPGATGLPRDVDVLVLEPALEGGLELARALRVENPELPVICTCSEAPATEFSELSPIAYLVKPFALADLERALLDAVRRSVARASEA
jgi:CheY-like chemotaxis protein